MPSLSNKQLAELSVRIPTDLDEQNRMVEYIEELDEQSVQLGTLSSRKLSLLAELKQSILQKAFRGELTADASVRELPRASDKEREISV